MTEGHSLRRLASCLAVPVLVAACLVERPGPESVTNALGGSIDLSAERPVAILPVVVHLTPGGDVVQGVGRNEYGSATVDTDRSDEKPSGATVIAIPTGLAQPRAWLLGPSIQLPVLTPEELNVRERCAAGATCDHPYRLLVSLDQPARVTLDWELIAGISLPAGTDTSKTVVAFDAQDPELLALPPTISDAVAGTVTLGGGPQERIVRLQYQGPRPNAWPLRAEAIVRATRPDGERSPLVQLDLLPAIGSTTTASRIFADHVAPHLGIVTSLFDGCAPAVVCERFLVLHFYDQAKPIDIDWSVEIRVRDYGSSEAVDAEVSVDQLSTAEAEAIAALPCSERVEAAIDLAAIRSIIDADEEARLLALLASGGWTPDEFRAGQFESLCRSLGAGD